MNLPDKIKAIVLTCDRYRAITEHMIFQYDQLWPDHPFVFHVPYQELGGVDTERVKYLTAPSDIKGTILHLLSEIDDEEWIYWCVDDKYPIQLVTDKIASLISHATRSPEVDSLLFCRCRATLNNPKLTLYPRARGVRNQARDFIGDELDRVFVIHAPVNPLFIVDLRQQMQDSPLNIRGRREILDPFGIHSAELLVRHMKNERMIRP